MKVNLGTGAQNSHDWERVLAGDFSTRRPRRATSACRPRWPWAISPSRSVSTGSGFPNITARHMA